MDRPLHLLGERRVDHPVLIDEAMLCAAASELPGLLGARSADGLPLQVEALASRPPGEHRGWKSMHVVFIVDGLDQMVIPGDRH